MTICAKCHRPVDLIEAVPDADADGVEIIFSCHGEKDRVFLTRTSFLLRKGSEENLITEQAFLGDTARAKGLGYRH